MTLTKRKAKLIVFWTRNYGLGTCRQSETPAPPYHTSLIADISFTLFVFILYFVRPLHYPGKEYFADIISRVALNEIPLATY